MGQIQSLNLLQTGSPHHPTSINIEILFHILFTSPYFLLPASYPLLLVSSEISHTFVTCRMYGDLNETEVFSRCEEIGNTPVKRQETCKRTSSIRASYLFLAS